jgi:hypothetical protein
MSAELADLLNAPDDIAPSVGFVGFPDIRERRRIMQDIDLLF